MKTGAVGITLLALSMLCAACDDEPAESDRAEVADAQPESLGPLYYRTYCENCHGPDGKGDGPAAEALPTRPPDLTRIAQRTGEFDRTEVGAFIDGRDRERRHAAPDMPAWGRILDDRLEVSLYEETRLTEPMIRELVSHLEAMQVVQVEPDP